MGLTLLQDIAPHKVIEHGAFPAFIHTIAGKDREDIQLPLRIIEVLIADGEPLLPSSAAPVLSIAKLDTY